MLTSIKIENFRCLKSVEVRLKPLTVLIGQNDTGKSSFLSAISYLAEECGLQHGDSWRNARNRDVLISGQMGETRIERTTGKARVEPGLDNPLRPSRIYRLPSDGVAMICEGASDNGEAPLMKTDGGNLPAILDYYHRNDRKRFSDIESALQKLMPGLEQITLKTPKPIDRQIGFIIDNGYPILGDNVSTGVRLLIFFLALAYHEFLPKVCMIEEPETGIHPKRLRDVIELLREITEGNHGEHASQVILSTHSPYLLDCINPRTDQVLVFRRNDDGSRSAEPVDTNRLREFLDDFMLGEIWYNQEEAGLVKKAE